MKNELKISMLSVVCVMCATVVMPAFSASSVRSLGGVGTYNGASSAVAAKSGGNSSVDMSGSVRAGSMRVNNVSNGAAGATRVGSTRAATTPRLSIGKYLSGSSAISGGSSTQGGVNVGGSSNSGNDLRDRVAALEGFVDFKASGETLAEQLSAVKLDVESLKEDLKNVTGFVTDVVFDEATGELFVSVDGQQLPPYKLSDYFDGRVKEALQAVLDDITDLNGRLSDYYTKVETDAILANYATKAELPSIDGLVDTAALVEVQEALQAAIDAKLESDDLLEIDAAIKLLKTDKADASVVEGLKASLKTISDDYAKKSELDAVELRLQSAIDAIDIPSLDGYVKSTDLAEVATTGSYNSLKDKPTIPEKISQLQNDAHFVVATELGNYVNKGELAGKQDKLTAGQNITISGNVISADVDLSGYATKAELPSIDGLATKAELEALDIPSIDGLVDTAALAEVQEALQAAIDAKLESGDLLEINAAIELLKTDKADASVVEGLKASLKTISDDYAKKSELDAVELRLQNAIDAIDIPSLDAYATKQFVADNYVTLESAKTFALSEDVQGIVSALAEKASVSDVEAIDGRVQVLEKAGYQTATQVQGLIATASEDYVKKGAESQVVPSMLDLGAAGEATSGYMMLQAKSDGTSEWVNVVVD